MKGEKVRFKVYVKMSKVSLMTSLLTEDCSRCLPPQHKTLGRQLFGDVSGTARSVDDAERKRCRPGRSATCCRLSQICSFKTVNNDNRWRHSARACSNPNSTWPVTSRHDTTRYPAYAFRHRKKSTCFFARVGQRSATRRSR